MLSVINLIPALVIPAAQNGVPQQVRPQNAPEVDFKTFMLGIHSIITPFVRIAPYHIKLSSKASLSLKIKYCLFRIWNTVKAIFNQSEWQCAKRQLVQGPFIQLILKHAKDSLQNNEKFELFKKMIEKEAEFLLYLSIDNKASDANDLDKGDYANKCLELLKDHSKIIVDALADAFNDDNKALIQQMFNLPNQELNKDNMAQVMQNINNPQILIGLLPIGMAIMMKLDLNKEFADLQAGKPKEEILREIYTRVAPHIKQYQEDVLKEAKERDLMEMATIQAAQRRDAAENLFFGKL